MRLRKITRWKDGKSHGYWALVESFRTARGPRQRVVSYLGALNEENYDVDSSDERNNDQQTGSSSFKPNWKEIDLDRVEIKRCWTFGSVWLGLELMKRLRLIEFFRERMPRGKEEITWAEMATILVLARFCCPSSELYIAEHFYGHTALPHLLGIPVAKVNDDRLYRALDKLLPHKQALEAFLKTRMGKLFNIEYDLILYDITSTYFEGEAIQNPQAKRGYSRDKRPDCKQVCIALVVTREGIPLGYETLAGNIRDVTTLKEIVAKIEARYGIANRIWVVDRGMISKQNMKFLAEPPRRYIVGTSRSMLKQFEQALLSPQWKSFCDNLEVQYCSSPAYPDEVFILCRSGDRKAKEHAIHERFIKRVEDGLVKLQKDCDSGRLKNKSLLERKIGRLLGRNPRVARLYKIEVVPSKDKKIKINWAKNQKQHKWTELTEGCYLLRTNIKEWSEEELWSAYIQLTHAEAAFRIQKNDLKLRPLWHQKQHRVQAHIFVCFLAYVLWKALGQLCKAKGLGNEPRKVVDEIGRIQLCEVILPAKDGKLYSLHCISKPDKHQNILLHHLGFRMPSRLNPVQKM